MSDSHNAFKRRAHDLVDSLPHDATWTDLADYAMARADVEENGFDDESGHIAEEVLQEYERIHAEVERNLSE